MITRESLTDNPAEVEHLIRWWVVQDKFRYHRVLVRGTKEDFINSVWVRLLSSLPEGKSVECGMSTIVINNCRWELSDTNRGSGERTERAFLNKLRTARRVRPSDSVEDGEQCMIQYVQLRQLNIAIAWVLRTLPYRQAIIVRARFGLLGDKEMTLKQIGKVLKVTRECVRFYETKALNKIRHHSRARKLIPFLESTINGDSEQ